jgi:hypothetical protein
MTKQLGLIVTVLLTAVLFIVLPQTIEAQVISDTQVPDPVEWMPTGGQTIINVTDPQNAYIESKFYWEDTDGFPYPHTYYEHEVVVENVHVLECDHFRHINLSILNLSDIPAIIQAWRDSAPTEFDDCLFSSAQITPGAIYGNYVDTRYLDRSEDGETYAVGMGVPKPGQIYTVRFNINVTNATETRVRLKGGLLHYAGTYSGSLAGGFSPVTELGGCVGMPISLSLSLLQACLFEGDKADLVNRSRLDNTNTNANWVTIRPGDASPTVITYGKWPSDVSNNPCLEPESYGVMLFNKLNCEKVYGSTLVSSSHGEWVNLKDQYPNLEDKIASIKIKDGWSVRIYQHYLNYGNPGQSRCFNNSAWDLSQYRFTESNNASIPNGEYIVNSISSFKVFANSECKESTPLYCGPATASSGDATMMSFASVSFAAANSCTGPSLPHPNGCPAGENGWYCGGQAGVGGAKGTLYHCENGVYSVESTCSNGCLIKPQGVADVCAPAGTDFCKTVTWGGPGAYCKGDNLVSCSATKTTTNEVTCSFGCHENALFKSDTCNINATQASVSNESVKFYGDSEFGESSLRVALGAGKSNEPHSGTHYKSMKLPDGWSIRTYSVENQQGEERCWNSSQPLLENEGWHNKIESVEIFNTNVCPSSAPDVPHWDAYYYSGDSKWWDPDIPTNTAGCKLRVDGETLDVNVGSVAPCGGGSSPDNWVGEYVATRYFPEGDYIFNIENDDGASFFINGKDRFIRASSGNGPLCHIYHLNGNVDLRFMLREDSGDAKLKIDWTTDISACTDTVPPIGTMIAPERNTVTNSSSPTLLKVEALDQASGGEQTIEGVDKVEFYAKSNVWNNNELGLIGTSTAEPWEFNWDTSGYPEGIYFLTAKVFDGEGNDSGLIGDENFWTNVTIDRTAPTAQVAPVSLGSGFSFNVSWTGADSISLDNELNYDVQYQLACGGDWLEWVGFRAGTTATFSGRPGESYCFRARAFDAANNTGEWSAASNTISLPTCDANMFTAEYYNNTDFSGDPVAIVCENAIDHNWGDAGHGFGVGTPFGDGGDGALTINGTVVDTPIDSPAVGYVDTNLIYASNANFRVGQKIMIYQVKGLNAGSYQFTEITAYDHATGQITTRDRMKVNYVTEPGKAAQVLVVRQYTDVTVTAGSVWKAKDWNGTTGGILIFFANGVTDIQGTIDATGAGFRGGRSGANPNYLIDNQTGEQGEGISGVVQRSNSRDSHSGGGGSERVRNEQGNAGGGGGYGTAGEEGGTNMNNEGARGQGGAPIGEADMTHIFFGGAGGGGGFGDAEPDPLIFPVFTYGTGGDGGGIIFIQSNEIDIDNPTGVISSRGVKAIDGRQDIGAGGNGGGGAIYLKGTVANVGTDRIDASANLDAPGGTSAGRGRGGDGRVRIDYFDSVSGATRPIASTGQVTEGRDNFAVRWSGQFAFSPNRYRFNSFADDGMRVWVDNNLISDDWADGYTENSANAYVGETANIKVEYYERGGSALARLNIVPNANTLPVIDPIPAQTAALTTEFAELNLNDYGYDPDFDYIYWQTAGGSNIQVSVDDANIAHITKTAGWTGTETLTFTLYDVWDEHVSTEVTFTVLDNVPPVITSSPTTEVDEETTYSYQVTATDGDTDPLTFTLITGVPNMTLTPEGLLTWTTTRADVGDHPIEIQVGDGLSSVSQAFTLTVIDVPEAPTVNDIPDQTVDSGVSFAQINLGDYVTDPDVGETFTWFVLGDGDLQADINAGVVTVTYPDGWFGTENLDFTVTDSDGLTATDTAAFTVTSPYPCELGSFQTEYFNNRTLTGTPVTAGCEVGVSHNWGAGAPIAGINANNFSARWVGYLDFNQGGYDFISWSDDGIRVYLDDVLIMSQWNDHDQRTDLATQFMSEGIHKVTVEYYENSLDAIAGLKVQSAQVCTAAVGTFCAYYYGYGQLVQQAQETTINHDWGFPAPASGMPQNNFAAKWLGEFDFAGGNYIFDLTGDDGMRLWIDGEQVFNDWNDHSVTQHAVPVTLSSGRHSVMLEYYDHWEQAVAKLSWRDVSPCTVPTGTFCAEYFNNRTLSGASVLKVNSDSGQHNWGSQSPGAGVNRDNFSARLQGNFNFAGGNYRFTSISDDGIRVWVDGQRIINRWTNHSSTTDQFTLNLSPGQHNVRVEYYDNVDQAVMRVFWERR